MRTSRLFLLVAAAVVAGALLLNDSAAQPVALAPATRVGLCDILDVLTNCDRAKDQNAAIAKDSDRIQREDKARKDKLDEKEKELQSLTPGSPSARKLVAEFEQEIYQFDSWRKWQKGRMVRLQHDYMKDAYADVRKAVAKVAKARGIQVVLTIHREEVPTKTPEDMLRLMEAQKVVWHEGSVDLTEAVLLQINKDYKAGKR